MGNVAISLWGREVDKGLTADASNGKDGNNGGRSSAPCNARLDQLLGAEFLQGAGDLSFCQDALQSVVYLWREKGDSGFDYNVAVRVEDIYGEPHANLRDALCGDVDVRLEIGNLIDCGENGGWGDVIAE